MGRWRWKWFEDGKGKAGDRETEMSEREVKNAALEVTACVGKWRGSTRAERESEFGIRYVGKSTFWHWSGSCVIDPSLSSSTFPPPRFPSLVVQVRRSSLSSSNIEYRTSNTLVIDSSSTRIPMAMIQMVYCA